MFVQNEKIMILHDYCDTALYHILVLLSPMATDHLKSVIGMGESRNHTSPHLTIFSNMFKFNTNK